MQYLVTGGAGFIGSAVARMLVSETQHHVVVVDKLTYASRLDSLNSLLKNPRFNFERADICDAQRMRAIFDKYRPNVAMHLAAESHVDRSIDSPRAFIETNIVGTFTLLQTALTFCRKHRKDSSEFRFHHISTDEVFGSLGEGGMFNEMSPYRPSSPYAASKAASDHLVSAWHHTYGLPIVISNCSNNYGPYQFPEKLIPLMILHAFYQKALPVYGNGQNVRDWLHVDDHARALLLIAEKGRIGESYAIGGSTEITNLDLVTRICHILDDLVPSNRPRSQLIKFVADRPGHDLRYAIDAAKIRNELGWAPLVPLGSGLRDTVQWYLNNQQWCQQVFEDGQIAPAIEWLERRA